MAPLANRSLDATPDAMMNSQWTAQDVERFREQQRWRLRQKSQSHRPPPSNQHQELVERTRKVSLSFRRELGQFEAASRALSPRAAALAVTLRPAFAVARPAAPRKAESPLPHTACSMFNAFDSAASPEAFALARHNQSNNNQEDDSSMGEDAEMASGGEEEENEHDQDKEEEEARGSLWRRRRFVQGMEKRSPKLGRVALWDADGGNNSRVVEVERMPLPFADDDEL